MVGWWGLAGWIVGLAFGRWVGVLLLGVSSGKPGRPAVRYVCVGSRLSAVMALSSRQAPFRTKGSNWLNAIPSLRAYVTPILAQPDLCSM